MPVQGSIWDLYPLSMRIFNLINYKAAVIDVISMADIGKESTPGKHSGNQADQAIILYPVNKLIVLNEGFNKTRFGKLIW